MCAQVCRAAGYYEHALAVAQAAGEPEWYLDILLEDCHSYDEALVYLQSLPRQQAAAALGRHGKVLIPFLSLFIASILMDQHGVAVRTWSLKPLACKCDCNDMD